MTHRTLQASLLTIAITTLPLGAGAAELLPVMGGDYQANASLSLTLGSADVDLKGVDSDVAYGAELAFDCPLLKLDSGTIRQQASVTRFDEDGVKSTSFELNPHYLIDITDRFAIGFGPGFGYVDTSINGHDEGLWAVQAGASAHFNMGSMFLGAELRQQWTEEERFGTLTNQGADNLRFMVKAGFRF